MVSQAPKDYSTSEILLTWKTFWISEHRNFSHILLLQKIHNINKIIVFIMLSKLSKFTYQNVLP
jgi:hypothetical protein